MVYCDKWYKIFLLSIYNQLVYHEKTWLVIELWKSNKHIEKIQSLHIHRCMYAYFSQNIYIFILLHTSVCLWWRALYSFLSSASLSSSLLTECKRKLISQITYDKTETFQRFDSGKHNMFAPDIALCNFVVVDVELLAAIISHNQERATMHQEIPAEIHQAESLSRIILPLGNHQIIILQLWHFCQIPSPKAILRATP